MTELKSKRSTNKKISTSSFWLSRKNKEFYSLQEKKIKIKKLPQKNSHTTHWRILFFKIFIRILLLVYTKRIYILINLNML